MVSSASIIAAAADTDLSERIVAIMTTLSVENADFAAGVFRRELVTAEFTGAASLAQLHEYARAVRDQAIRDREAAIKAAEESHPIPPSPGLNDSVITDEHLACAIRALIDSGRITLQEGRS